MMKPVEKDASSCTFWGPLTSPDVTLPYTSDNSSLFPSISSDSIDLFSESHSVTSNLILSKISALSEEMAAIKELLAEKALTPISKEDIEELVRKVVLSMLKPANT